MICIANAMIDLSQTLASGQSFAFAPYLKGYLGVVDGHPIYVYQEENALVLSCDTQQEAFWRRYFDLACDYELLMKPYRDDLVVQSCLQAYKGLRILVQPVWETTCAFIISANNHQKRIESIYQALSKELGEPIDFCGQTLYSFPTAQVLANTQESTLRALGTGYRAPYLQKSARMVADGHSLSLDEMEYEQALKHLVALAGVGEKVADCILLFASTHRQAFPIDVWMERVMKEQYGFVGSRRSIKLQSQAFFGASAGIVQQWLFHGIRTGIIKQEKDREKA